MDAAILLWKFAILWLGYLGYLANVILLSGFADQMLNNLGYWVP